MKAKRPPQRETDVVEKIVDDLAQQDVLPPETQSDVPDDVATVMNAEDQAGNWEDPAGGKGHQAARTPLEDESEAAEILVERGVSEAEAELEELDEEETPEETS
jgi:TATA-binding protein-associated factor Taf7